jgi:acetyl coenzyme A synthetase (ADP forming)-like protein
MGIREKREKSLEFLFYPKSVAIIGASGKRGKWGYEIMKNLVEAKFEGRIYPINPGGGEIFGFKAFASVMDVNEPVDLAVIGIPAERVLGAVRECITKGVTGVVIVTAGFAEIGNDGEKLQDKIVETAKDAGMRIVGPNCLGVLSAASRLNATILPYTTGNLALISQSGNFCIEAELIFRRSGLGFSRMVSIGNQVDIGLDEYIRDLKSDTLSKVILLFIEGFRDGHAFLKEAKAISMTKPIVALKVGATSAGRRAAMSHTGSIAGVDKICDAAFRQAGIIRVTGTHEVLDVGEALSKLPPMNGKRIGILTDGGGHASAAADIAEKYGLEMPALPVATQKRLKEAMLPQSNARNPVDFAGAAENDLWAYKRVLEIIFEEKNIDGLLIAGALFGGYAELYEQEQVEIEVAAEIVKISKEFGKPIVLHSPYPREEFESIKILREGGIPVYQRVETAALCLAAHAEYWAYRRKLIGDGELTFSTIEVVEEVKGILDQVRKKGRLNLVDLEAIQVLRAYQLPICRAELARDVAEAVRISKEFEGEPVVIKVCSPQIIHKTDAGGIKVDVNGEYAVEKACKEILDNASKFVANPEIYGLMVCEMLPKGTEIIVGGLRDPQFGPVVMFGLGGIFVEILKDISFRVAPVSGREALEMIEEIRGYPILKGQRGEQPKDLASIVDVLTKVSRLMADQPDIAELDLNPIFVYEDEVRIADVRMILSEEKD